MEYFWGKRALGKKLEYMRTIIIINLATQIEKVGGKLNGIKTAPDSKPWYSRYCTNRVISKFVVSFLFLHFMKRQRVQSESTRKRGRKNR
jgi:hypothetical protein